MATLGAAVAKIDGTPSRLRGWLPVLILPPAVVLVAPADWPRWAVMWTLAFAIYVGCKWLTWRQADTQSSPVWRQVAYLVGWPGLDADRFLSHDLAKKPAIAEWLFAFGKLGCGGCLLWGVLPASDELTEVIRGWIGMTGILFVLHFGLFHVLSCLWRSQGIAARPLMQMPIAAASVADFWSRRWNTAFRDLTHRFCFLPLAGRMGPRPALFATFLVSGLVHDAVISLPAGGGYGGPTAYFLIQASGLTVERSHVGRRIGLRRNVIGRLFAIVVIAVPVPLLFHSAFVTRVMLPLLEFVGAMR